MPQETLYSTIIKVSVILLMDTISQTTGVNIVTRLGQIEGSTAVVNNVNVHQFLKIPFAKPPVGTLRFRKPEPFGNWNGTLKATEFGPSCMQYIYENDKRLIPNLNITEDCLQLNVFVPGDINRQSNLTVMIWVHGGSLTNGQGTMFNGSYLASRTNVIVVTINYRLNVFGFLYAGLDSNFKGHYGFFDQQLAFKWVKDNIEDFGGNPNSITIFGESAGGVSVTLQSILPSNLGLFQRVIAESGSVMVPADVPVNDTDSLNVMKQTAKLLNCSRFNIDETILCLQSINASYLMAKYYESMSSNIVFSSPAGELFNQSLFKDLKNHNSAAYEMLQSIDLMAGTNTGEAGLEYFELAGYQKSWGFNISANIPERILCEHIAPAITEEWFKTCDDLSVAICHSYLQNLAKNATLLEQTQAAADLFADLAMNYPTFYLLQLHSNTKNTKTYQYSFAHKPTWELIQDRPAWLTGPNHASELAFVFGLEDWYPHTVSPTSAELDLSHSMMDMWTNFAKTGNPNTGQTRLWKSFDMRDRHYLSLDIPLKPGKSLYGSRMDFWDKDIPNIVHACRSGEYVIPTSLGRIRGILTEVSSKKISLFKKVPYALPPLNKLRFAKPLPVTPWNGTLGSTEFGPSCVQFLDKNNPRLPNVNMSEDCLHLNIYAPFPTRQTSRRAVMIWIHGGGFIGGQGTSIDGSRLVLKGDIIVVTINYRLNIFGFFSTGSSDTRGNYGLYDQQLAIKWVKENIVAFGGDPNRITLFGESAGGVSTTLQGVIPSNKGMFLRVIGESGSFLARRDYETKTRDTSHQVIAKLSCQRASETEMLDCLRSKNTSDLLKVWGEISWKQSRSDSYSLTTSIGPITDGELIPESPDAAMSNPNSLMHKQFYSIDLLVGTNTADSGLLYFNLKPYSSIFKFNISVGVPTRIVCDEIAPSIVREIYEINCPALVTAICKQYTPTPPATLQAQSQMAADLYGDFLEDVPTIKSLNAHAQSTRSTFQYLFSHRPIWEVIGERPMWLKGANHASELPFVFGLKTFYPSNVQITQEEQALADQMMEYWTNFAKYGNPKVNSTGIWKPYTVNKRDYIRLDLNITMSSSLYKDRVHFWTDTAPRIVKDCHQRSANSASIYNSNISMILLTCIFLSSVKGNIFQNGTVDTKYGRIQGSLKDVNGLEVYIFLKVPYSLPPIGSLRFRKPQPVVPWNGVLDATKPGPSCYQKISKSYKKFLPSMNVSEDCLYMNIYIPASVSHTNKFSVMVYIHGGGYSTKSANLHDGSRLSATGNVIIILINYRLGMFGFLSTEDENARGNYGLWDQIEALKWIQENIGYFGGNPSSVTVFGHSAGGYSIGLLLLSKHSFGLFHRAIAMSGLGLNRRSVTHNARNAAFRIAKFVGCFNDTVEYNAKSVNSSYIVSCLRAKSPLDILIATGKMRASYHKYDFIMRPGPVIDGELLSNSPERIINDPTSEGFKTFMSADIIAGTNDEDGWLLRSKLKDMQSVYHFNLDDGVSTSAMCDGVVKALVRDYFHSNPMIANQICNMYLKNSSILAQGHATLDMYGDMLYASPAVQTLRRHRSGLRSFGKAMEKKTFHFLFTHKPTFPVITRRRKWLTGAQHGDETWFIFQNKNFNYTVKEQKLSDDFVRYLTNFAKTGDPNSANMDIVWLAFNEESESYITIHQNITTGQHLFRKRMAFWLDTVPSLLHTSTSSQMALHRYSVIQSIRLVGPAGVAGQGRVEIQKDGIWGTVCDDQFDMMDAKVVCRMLGSKGNVHLATVEGVFGKGTGRIFFDELQCVGTETDLDQCRSNSFHDCFHSEDAGVICDSDSVKFRLVGGSDSNSGRVEVNLNGLWGTVCDDEFDTRAAKVVCKQLGLPYANAFPNNFGPGTGSIWLDDVMCTGSEGNILECNQTEIGNNDCDHTEDIGVVCTDTPPKLQIRLVGGARTDEGRVEVNIGAGWGTVCDDEWDSNEAAVVCRMLGFTGGIPRAVAQGFFGQGTGSILMDDVNCTGTESTLASCGFAGYGSNDCDHTEDAGVICHAENSQALKVRLVGGANEKEGRVEVFFNNTWGTVCDDQFDDREAKVFCRMLGFNGTAVGLAEAHFGPGTGPIFLDDVSCSGTEDTIATCSFAGYGQSDCDHTEDASVICDAGHQNISIRLVNGKVPNEGRVEVLYHGVWGTVCDDRFDSTNAKVVCRMLGFPTGNAEAVTGGRFGAGTGKIWLDNVDCNGMENSIVQCRHQVWGSNNCDHSEDVGVRCGSTIESPVRLVGGSTPYEGRLEIFHEGRWGTVCNNGFDKTAAKIICNSIGYPSDNPTLMQATNFGVPPATVWLDGVRCMGNETSIDVCTHNRFGLTSCGHDKDVAIMCRAHGIKCYHCDGVQDPVTCNEEMQCSAGEICEEAAYIANGETRFSLTCQSKLVCDALQGNAIGRRDVVKRQGQTVQVKCCDTPLCNRNLIDKSSIHGGHGHGHPSTGCQDDPKMDCSALDGINICANVQAAKIYCPLHCGLCTRP
ncbi:uncharacterized protein LOC133186505 [Saccostrea echinata]|uniref:uncharacterized protein LOC133186505 n=1 Tax=Saccostrea echinata TaxID=191078 RepID=UPI002A7FFA67|nr:uncharacterized protein LOC133186505 [Saccostrea echinata]